MNIILCLFRVEIFQISRRSTREIKRFWTVLGEMIWRVTVKTTLYIERGFTISISKTGVQRLFTTKPELTRIFDRGKAVVGGYNCSITKNHKLGFFMQLQGKFEFLVKLLIRHLMGSYPWEQFSCPFERYYSCFEKFSLVCVASVCNWPLSGEPQNSLVRLG